MSISRIGETQAKPETTEALRGFLISIMPGIKSSQGCESVTLYQSQDDPTKFTMIEVWDSIESHQTSVKNIPPEMLAEIRPLLASAPSGGYFGLVTQKNKPRKERTITELCKITDRLFYEWDMLTISAQELQDITDKFLESVFIESGAIHSRAPVKFLYSSNSMSDDAIAEDFFINAKLWTDARSPMPADLTYENFVKFANRQIAHIVYTDEDKHQWNFTAIAEALQPTLEKFIESIRQDQLGERWFSLLDSQVGTYWEKFKQLVNSKSG